MTSLKETETTNFLLLLILLVLLAGFGFLLPIFWALAGIVGLWLLFKILSVFVEGVSSVFETIATSLENLFSPFWRFLKSILWNDLFQWVLLISIAGLSIWSYYSTQQEGYLIFVVFSSLFLIFKLINRWDSMRIERKYSKNGGNDA